MLASWRKLRTLARLLAAVSFLALATGSVCLAYPSTPDLWITMLSARDQGSGGGFTIAVSAESTDGYDGGDPLPITSESSGIFLAKYEINGPDWTGPTGFYGADGKAPIAAGGSKTWSNIYLWAQNYQPVAGNRVSFRAYHRDYEPGPPLGYVGHLVLDYVPLECAWDGPMEWWLDLTAYNEFTMPIATVTDPLQGVRMHITVYAPIPEPSALRALGFGLAGLAAVRRRRR